MKTQHRKFNPQENILHEGKAPEKSGATMETENQPCLRWLPLKMLSFILSFHTLISEVPQYFPYAALAWANSYSVSDITVGNCLLSRVNSHIMENFFFNWLDQETGIQES